MTGRTHALVESPLGVLTLVEQDGAVAALHLRGQRHLPDPLTFGERDDAALPELRAQLDAYFAGELRDFDVPLATVGTPFQQRVWTQLRAIPYAQTRSYGDVALALGQPGAGRAVGLANGRNPISIVVPCHRVVGSTGRLVGYGGGLERKQWLLAHERGALPHPSPAAGAATA